MVIFMPKCPRCDAETDQDAHAGLCPKCLIKGAFETSQTDSETQTIDARPQTGAEDEFDRYRIIRPLGEGGMGTVYLAEQKEPIRRTVALKVIKQGMDTGQVLTRFANERQALALMNHPNIARIFDAGATRHGKPYFVMEYIEGRPITHYCDLKRMTIDKRLELFSTVCLAVEHAHRQGVIHRDLKPSNVLVKEQEEAPVPKVIDFGIAKATNQQAVQDTLVTQLGQIVGTPEYASPEQVDGMTGAVDATSDVYSLGIVLYELLTSRVPFDAERMRRLGLIEVVRIIREEEAPPLVRKLETVGTSITDIAARRQVDAPALRRLLDGDLNSITLKALEKSPARRYPSAAEFAADIRRYLRHEPVEAAPSTALDRAREFFRRHKSALIGRAGKSAGSPSEHRESPDRSSPAASKIAIVLAGFTNNTGEPGLEERLRQMTAAELGKSSRFSVLSETRINETLRLMVLKPDARLTSEIASEICERTGSAALVEGWVSSLGNRYVLGVRASNPLTGDIFHEEQSPPAKKAHLFVAFSQLVERFAARAGELLISMAKEPSLPADVTTSSREAWRSYSAAMKELQTRAQSAEVVSLLKRAIEIDPKFAMAYAALGRNQADVGDVETSAESVAKAYELSREVSDRENYYITFTYHRQLTRNLERCRQILESWARKYPLDLYPRGFLSGFASPGTGRYERAVEEGLKAIEFDPGFAIGYENVAFAYLYLNRLSEATAVLEKAADRKIELVQFSLVRYFIAFLKGDKAAMEAEKAQRRARLEAQGWFEHQEAMTLAYEGRLKEANRLSAQSLILARQAGFAGRVAAFQGAAALWNAFFGNHTDAEQAAAATLSLFRSRDTDYGPAIVFAVLKQPARAREIAAELEERYPEDTSVQFSYLPVLRALEALNEQDAAKALDMTQTSVPYDLATPGTAYFTGSSFYGALYPVYVRGLAHSLMGQHREAAKEFERILQHPGITLNDPVGPLARLQLARALSASGDCARSRTVYRDLLAIWQNADSDITLIRDARAEFAQITAGAL
jgi:eukaryotic-like serine/threonine-protein kinase